MSDKNPIWTPAATEFVCSESIKKQNGVIMRGILMPEGEISRNGVLYNWDTVKEKHRDLIGKPVMYNHEIESVNSVSLGHYTDSQVMSVAEILKNPEYKVLKNKIDKLGYTPEKQLWVYTADLDPQEDYYINKIRRGDLQHVSIQLNAERTENMVDDMGNQYTIAYVDDIIESSVVPTPGFIQTCAMLSEKYGGKKMKEDVTTTTGDGAIAPTQKLENDTFIPKVDKYIYWVTDDEGVKRGPFKTRADAQKYIVINKIKNKQITSEHEKLEKITPERKAAIKKLWKKYDNPFKVMDELKLNSDEEYYLYSLTQEKLDPASQVSDEIEDKGAQTMSVAEDEEVFDDEEQIIEKTTQKMQELLKCFKYIESKNILKMEEKKNTELLSEILSTLKQSIQKEDVTMTKKKENDAKKDTQVTPPEPAKVSDGAKDLGDQTSKDVIKENDATKDTQAPATAPVPVSDGAKDLGDETSKDVVKEQAEDEEKKEQTSDDKSQEETADADKDDVMKENEGGDMEMVVEVLEMLKSKVDQLSAKVAALEAGKEQAPEGDAKEEDPMPPMEERVSFQRVLVESIQTNELNEKAIKDILG